MTNPYVPMPTQYDHPDLEEHRALLRSAPRLAWYYVRLLVAGGPSRPGPGAPEVELIAWRIYRRGYSSPPLWLRWEWLQETLRSWVRAPSKFQGPGTGTGGR
jgi:hypothetical protein